MLNADCSLTSPLLFFFFLTASFFFSLNLISVISKVKQTQPVLAGLKTEVPKIS